MNEKSDVIKEELILLLIFLTGFEEYKRNAPGEKIFRAWRYYNFDILDNLEKQKLIYQIPGGRSLVLTDEGKQKVEQLKQKYLDKFGK